MVVVSWRLQYEPLCEIGRPRCLRCGNRSEHVLVKKKRGVKVMFVPVYKGSAGHATICAICSQITPIDDAAARTYLLCGLGDEYSRLYMSPHLQSAEARIAAAQILMPYLDGPELKADLASITGAQASEEQVRLQIFHCMAWRLSHALQISMPEAEQMIYEDAFPPGQYVDHSGTVLVNIAELNQKIAYVRGQAASGRGRR